MTLIDESPVPVRLNEAHTDTDPIKMEAEPDLVKKKKN